MASHKIKCPGCMRLDYLLRQLGVTMHAAPDPALVANVSMIIYSVVGVRMDPTINDCVDAWECLRLLPEEMERTARPTVALIKQTLKELKPEQIEVIRRGYNQLPVDFRRWMREADEQFPDPVQFDPSLN